MLYIFIRIWLFQETRITYHFPHYFLSNVHTFTPVFPYPKISSSFSSAFHDPVYLSRQSTKASPSLKSGPIHLKEDEFLIPRLAHNTVLKSLWFHCQWFPHIITQMHRHIYVCVCMCVYIYIYIYIYIYYTPAWKIPWMEEPGRLQSMGSLSQTWLRNFTFTFHFHALEKEMATHSSVLAWRIPGTGKPGGPQSIGLHRVGHDWSDLAAAAARMYIYVSPQLSKGW